MQEYAESLSNALRVARNKLQLTQSEIAELAGVGERTILNIENQRGNPKMEVLYPLVRSLSLDANAIFYPESSQANQATHELIRFLSQRSDKELDALLPICKTCIDVMSNGQHVED